MPDPVQHDENEYSCFMTLDTPSCEVTPQILERHKCTERYGVWGVQSNMQL